MSRWYDPRHVGKGPRADRLRAWVPSRIRTNPLAAMVMFLWVAAGAELFRAAWPYDMWPSVVNLVHPEDRLAYFTIASAMIASGALWWAGQMFPFRSRVGGFLTWLSLWSCLTVAGILVCLITATVILSEYFYPEVCIAGAFWLIIAGFFGLSIAREHDLITIRGRDER